MHHSGICTGKRTQTTVFRGDFGLDFVFFFLFFDSCLVVTLVCFFPTLPNGYCILFWALLLLLLLLLLSPFVSCLHFARQMTLKRIDETRDIAYASIGVRGPALDGALPMAEVLNHHHSRKRQLPRILFYCVGYYFCFVFFFFRFKGKKKTITKDGKALFYFVFRLEDAIRNA